MKRRLLNLLTALSLLLCVAACVLWVRSYYLQDIVLISAGRRFVHFHGLSGSCVAMCEGNTLDLGWSSTWVTDGVGVYATTNSGAMTAFDASSMATQGSWFVAFPLWIGVAAFGVLPAARTLRAVGRRPRSPGLCASCGYDLRATPGRCPECGALAAVGTAP